MDALQQVEKDTALVGPFVWVTQRGERIHVTRMKTSHLFYSIRMIYNNSCSPGWQTRKDFNRFVLKRPVTYWKEAVKALSLELSGRDDLTTEQLNEMEQMFTSTRLFFSKQLKDAP